MKTGLDLLVEEAMLGMVDPRPIVLGKFAENFVKYMGHSGLLASDIKEAEVEHLVTKLENMVRGYIRKDRQEFHGINITTRQ